jgi:uncharacterized protein (DUF433 family)
MMRVLSGEIMSSEKVKLDLRAIPPAIEERDRIYYFTQSSITFAAVILRFKEGLSPETIRRGCFPALPLAKIYSAVSFYLNNQAQVEDYLSQVKQDEDALQQELLAAHPGFIETAEAWRERTGVAPRK